LGRLARRLPVEDATTTVELPVVCHQTQVSLVRLAALRSFIDAEVPGLSGYLVPPRPRRFRQAHAVFLRHRPPLSMKKTGSSSHELRFRFRELFACHRPAPPKQHGHASSGFGSSSRQEQLKSTTRWFPRPPSFRPRRFSRPRRFTPSIASWVCFTPLPRAGFTFQGFSLRPSQT
jgi:hypothetical protein